MRTYKDSIHIAGGLVGHIMMLRRTHPIYKTSTSIAEMVHFAQQTAQLWGHADCYHEQFVKDVIAEAEKVLADTRC